MSQPVQLAWYGDDFTGSTDVLEALALAGLRAALFLRPPDPARRAAFGPLDAFGIAGGSRTMSPDRMERELPAVFECLRHSGARVMHYKLCSTFDSSPSVGSIGRAIEIGRQVFGDRPTPLVVGAPVLGRYVAFGNLFARSGLDTEPFRLDRHPTMSRHPVTPMNEADLRRVLGAQTGLPVQLVDTLEIEAVLEAAAGTALSAAMSGRAARAPAPILLFDTLRPAHLPVIGRAIWEMTAAGPLFVAGSSGVEYALVAAWRAASAQEPLAGGVAAPAVLPVDRPGVARPASRIIAVSGSCSPVTDRQIAHAVGVGFHEFALPGSRLATDGFEGGLREAVLADVLPRLAAGQSVVLHTCRAPGDARMIRDGGPAADLAGRLGPGLASVLESLMEASGIRRVVVCGGDTSLHVARSLGIDALEYVGAMAPGSPLCRVHAPGRVVDGCEMVFKGGQVGRDTFFSTVLGVEEGGDGAGGAPVG